MTTYEPNEFTYLWDAAVKMLAAFPEDPKQAPSAIEDFSEAMATLSEDHPELCDENGLFIPSMGIPTGRKFIVTDDDEFLAEPPEDPDGWHEWTEYRDARGALSYVSDHEDYTLDAEEFGPIPSAK